MCSYRILAVLLVLALIPLSSCGGDGDVSPTPQPRPDEEQVLHELPSAQVIGGAFAVSGLMEERDTLVAADGSRYRPLGRLIGPLISPRSPALAVFVDYRPSETGVRGQGSRPAGVYAVAVEVDDRGQPRYGPLSVISAGGESILPLQEGLNQGVAPFQQESRELDTAVSVFPALLVDLEGDGVEEMVLARRFRQPGLSWRRYDVYRRLPEGEGWALVGPEGEETAPGLAVLDYWASVAAATGVARRWDPRTRLVTVWSWLAEEGAPVTPELIQGLVPDGDPEKARKTQEALTQTRQFFEQAHAHFSTGFLIRQPWPGFINGFKKTEDVDVLSVSPPGPVVEGRTSLDVLLDLTEREGPDPVARRLLVTMDVVQEGEGWFLDGVEASEQRQPAPALTPK